MKDQPLLAYMLATLFIGLKLTGQIDWSWFWILTPLWLGFAWAVVWGFVKGFYVSFNAARKSRARKLN